MKGSKNKISIIASLMLICCFIATARALPSIPYTMSYSARLTNTSGAAIATTQTIRFSLWTSTDFTTANLLVNGQINPVAANFTGWEEVYDITPDTNGLFTVSLGSIVPLNTFPLSTDMYLQVEVKPLAAADTVYEVLDPQGNTADTVDRFALNSNAFAMNADMVDNRDIGNAANNIPALDALGKLNISTIPGGTNAINFILDNSNIIVGAGSVSLQFGQTLAKILEYNNAMGYFNFNDDLNIMGNLTTTGTINNVTINSTTVGPYDQSINFEPLYASAIIERDGANNRGTLENLFIDVDGGAGNNNVNYYKWTTQQTSLQDIDVVLRIKIPEGFVSWQATPIEFIYKTDNLLTADNKLDLTLEDTNGATVTLTNASNLTSTSFTTSNVTFIGTPTFTPGQSVTLKVKLTARNGFAAYAGKLKLNYNGK